jgi:tryptophan-rich sensory protein
MIGWYKNLNKAPWSPPNYVFGIVWPILYILMCISVLLVYFDTKCFPYCSPITYFLLQLILNLSWTTIFFKFRQLILALLIIILVILLTSYTSIIFYPINKIASLLLIPYILWLCLAFSLNLYIVIYN